MIDQTKLFSDLAKCLNSSKTVLFRIYSLHFVLISSHLNLSAAEFLVRQVTNLSGKFKRYAWKNSQCYRCAGNKMMASMEEEETLVSTAEGTVRKKVRSEYHHPSIDPFLVVVADCSSSISRICRAFVGNVGMLDTANWTISRYERTTSFNKCYVSCIESSWLRLRFLSREIRDERRNRDLRILITGRFFSREVIIMIILR